MLFYSSLDLSRSGLFFHKKQHFLRQFSNNLPIKLIGFRHIKSYVNMTFHVLMILFPKISMNEKPIKNHLYFIHNFFHQIPQKSFLLLMNLALKMMDLTVC